MAMKATPRPSVESSPERPTRRPSRSMVFLLALALLVGGALGAVLFGDSAEDGAAVQVADPSVVRRVDAGIADVNAMDVDAVAAGFSKDAVFTDLIDGRVTRGAYDIALTYAQSGDFNLRRTSDVVELGGVATFSVNYGGGSAVVVLKYEHGRITQAVVMAP